MTLNTAQIIRKGYKKTEIGVIPDDWEVKQMGKVATSIASGKSKSKFAIGTYPVFGSTGIIGWNDQYDYQGNKILIARVGANAGTVNIVDAKYGVSDNTLIVSYDKNTDINFSYYQLISIRLNQLVFGSGQPLITGGQLKSLLVPLPPTKAEQTAIATALSDADALISRLEELIAKKRNIKQGVMQELLTGKKRLPGFNGKWEVKELGEIAEMSSGGTPLTSNNSYYGGQIPWVVIADMTRIKKYLFNTEKNITEIGLRNSSAKLFKKGTLLFAMYASIGKCAIAKVDITCNQAILGINTKKIDTEFLYYYLAFNEQKFLQMGQTGTQNNLNKEIVQNLDIPYPSSQEQTAIAQVLSDMDAEIEQLEQKLDKFKMIKQGMMQELLTGKTRLL